MCIDVGGGEFGALGDRLTNDGGKFADNANLNRTVIALRKGWLRPEPGEARCDGGKQQQTVGEGVVHGRSPRRAPPVFILHQVSDCGQSAG
ncbi:MAG: hypothetical protein JO122_16510 [Acetobacteraceae bacterium]|nr:hypothetical protein [Acetobacteraceae bacterium]